MAESSHVVSRVAGCTALAAFIYQFENCMTTTALPVMSREVAGLSGVISLVTAAYLMAALVAMVPAGRLAARVGHNKVLAGALGLMGLGSLICWLAPGCVVLLGGRWIEGLGGGAMASAAYGLVAVRVPPERRRGVMGGIAMGAGLGMVVGAPLGGLVAAVVSWRALFGLQVPLLFVAALVMWGMNFGKHERALVNLGLGRSIYLGAGAGCACVAGGLGRDWGWLSPAILGLVTAAVVLLAGFVWSEQRVKEPLFPGEVWREGAFWPYWGLLFAMATALGGTLFLLPFYLHEAVGMSVPAAARWMVILVAGYSVAALNAGRLQKIMSGEQQGMTGALLALAGVGLLASNADAAIGWPGVALSCGLTGVGLGMVSPAVSAGCVARLPEAFRGLGAALLPLGINLGSMTGVVASAEIREWHLGAKPQGVIYGEAFLVALVALVFVAAGFWRAARRTA